MEHKAYILRTCGPDMTSWGGFVWPREGVVECPDWKFTTECGNGLHGLLWGEGDGNLLDWSDNSIWVVAGVEEYIDLSGKVKFPRADVVFTGERDEAIEKIVHLGATGAVVGLNVAAGDSGTATAGARGTATAGDFGTATAGARGTATAGDFGTATAGDRGTATAGDGGTATAGDRGTATAGDGGTATAGDGGTAAAGYGGTAAAGYGGILCLSHYDSCRKRIMIAYVGEDGIKPNTPYRLNGEKFVEAE